MGVLRDIFLFIHQGNGVPEQIEWILDSIAETLAETDVNKILRNKKRTDSIVHFYETFLSKYDPKSKKKRGVYYTPEPVVSYIVKSLHHILQKNFNKSEGFADETVTVLDPAAGTLTFLAEAIKIAVREYVEIHGSGEKNDFIRRHILKNFYAFEVMMVPYVIGHLKMSFLFEQLGCNLNFNNRFNFHITNTLEMEIADQPDIPNILPSLSEESRLAGMIKKEQPVLVILGNPPYSTHSANKGKWIDDLLKKNKGNYYDKILGEKNSKVISDDYVKFIRFAQWKIDNKGEGVLGFITNHSYLSNRTFRGMRESLMHSFDEIYILNLHGNSTKKRNAPRGSKNKNGKDENVFDIRQGVAISIVIKNKNSKPETENKI